MSKKNKNSTAKLLFDLDWQRSLFLGPHGENDQSFEKILLDIFRDHIYWRRNFHYEDPTAIPADSLIRPGFLHGHSNIQQEIYKLASELKGSVPIYSPRYMGHMVSDTLIPAKLSYFLGLLYNPNNVSFEVSPITTKLEMESIEQLCKMIGYPSKKSGGFLTGGGTIANFESLRIARELKALPIAWTSTALKFGIKKYLPSSIAFLNPDEGFHLSNEIKSTLEKKGISTDKIRSTFHQCSYSYLGESFWATNRIKPPIMFISKTSHYGWKKGAHILGYGSNRLRLIDIDQNFRINIKSLENELKTALKEKIPVAQIIGIAGSTEYGAVDSIHDILKIKNKYSGFYFHVDAAWGGYFCTLKSSQNRNKKTIDNHLFSVLNSIKNVDSVTVDPHKLGFMPYPAGAFLVKNKAWLCLNKTKAPYTFDEKAEQSIGEISIEGSRPGATSAMVALTHRVCPPNENGIGKIIEKGFMAKDLFLKEINHFNTNSKTFEILLTCLPDSNIVTFLVNPKKNKKTTVLNELNKKIYYRYRIDSKKSISSHDFFISKTILSPSLYPKNKKKEFYKTSSGRSQQTIALFLQEDIFVLRCVFMNPFLLDESEKKSYFISEFFKSLTSFLNSKGDN